MRKSHLLPAASITFVAVLVAACGGSRPDDTAVRALPDAFPNHTVEQVQMFVTEHGDSLSSFKARASVSVKSPQQSASFGSSIDFRRADSLYLNVKAMLGIEAARALVTPDSFFVYDRIKRKLYYGDIDKAESVLPIPVAGAGIFELMLGLGFAPGSNWTMTADTSHYVFQSADRLTHVTVDPRYWRIARYVKRDAGGAVSEERSYSDFSDFDGVVLPRRVVLSRPAEDTYASIYYNRLELNPASLELELSVSDNAERVHVR